MVAFKQRLILYGSIICIFLFSLSACQEQVFSKFSEGISAIVKQLNETNKSEKKLTIAVVGCVELRSEQPLKISAMLEEELANQMARLPAFNVVERKRITELETEFVQQSRIIYNENTTKKIGKMVGATAILTGGYEDLGEIVAIYLRIIDIETGIVLSTGMVRIKKTAIPEHLWQPMERFQPVASDSVEKKDEIKSTISDNSISSDSQAKLLMPDKNDLFEKPKILKFGVTPYLKEAVMRRAFQPFLNYLADQTGIKFELVITSDYSQLSQRMKVGEIDIGVFSPFAYVDGVKTADVRIFASQLADGGQATYHGLIITHKNSKIKTIDNLKGKSFGFVDPKSASGFIYPRAMLISKGYNPSEFFSSTLFLGSHDKVIASVMDGSVDAGAVYEGAFHIALENKVPVDQLYVISKTDPIPYDAFTAQKNLSPIIVKEIQKSLIQLDRRTAKGKEILDNELRIDGFIIGDDSRYNVVRDAAAFRREQIRAALLSFQEMGTQWEVPLSQTITELFQNLLVQSQKFRVISENEIRQAFQGENFESIQELDSTTWKKFADELKIKILIGGSIIHLGKKISISVKMHEVPGGAIHSAFTKSGFEDGISLLIEDIVKEIGDEYPVCGYVIVSEDNKIMVDFGSEDGVKEGSNIVVYQEGKLLKNPLTGEILGRQEDIIAEAEVLTATPKVATCQIIKGNIKEISFGKRARTLRKNEKIYLP
ncbi:MAG: phosphate/phosphite/phosphonate ABC transporter substrate-binding protein [Desulfobacterales bacterium]|nr:phosphate/phosphite/phosphonate ABC transporter substrate-binding protein [Desulfobacterales bacterium]